MCIYVVCQHCNNCVPDVGPVKVTINSIFSIACTVLRDEDRKGWVTVGGFAAVFHPSCRRFFIKTAEGLTYFTAGKHCVGWAMYSMFFSACGIISDHIGRRVAELDALKVANRRRKQSEAYKRRTAALEYQQLGRAEKRKEASAMKQYEYKDGAVGGTGGAKMYMTEAAMDAAVQAAAEKKAEIKAMSQAQMRLAWDSGQRQGLDKCVCGWMSKGKPAKTHLVSAAHLNWRWEQGDRTGLELCTVCKKQKVLVSGSAAAKHAADHQKRAGLALLAQDAEASQEADDEGE